MEEIYLKYYQQKVQFVTYQTALPHHQLFVKQFGSKRLSDINTIDCERFRLAIIDKYSSNYVKNMWSDLKHVWAMQKDWVILIEFLLKD